jgi:hypothetical protein
LEKALPAVMFPEFHRENGPFCVVVWVMLSLFVQVERVADGPGGGGGIEAGRDPDDRDVHRCSPGLTRHQQEQRCRQHQRDRATHAQYPFRSSERSTAAGLVRMVR